MNNIKSEFAIRLKYLRTKNGLSQLHLAQEINATKQNISDWETGKSETSFEMLVKVAKFFNVSTDYLLGLEDLVI